MGESYAAELLERNPSVIIAIGLFNGTISNLIQLVGCDIGSNHRIQDHFELLAGDVSVLIKVIHLESN